MCVEPCCTAPPHLRFCCTRDFTDSPGRTPEASQRVLDLVLAPSLKDLPMLRLPANLPLSARRPNSEIHSAIWIWTGWARITRSTNKWRETPTLCFIRDSSSHTLYGLSSTGIELGPVFGPRAHPWYMLLSKTTVSPRARESISINSR